MFMLVHALVVLPKAAVFGGLVFRTLCCLCWRTGPPLGLLRTWVWCLCVVWWWRVAPFVLLCTCVLHTIHSPFKSLHTILLFCGDGGLERCGAAAWLVSCSAYLITCVTYIVLLVAACMCEYGHNFSLLVLVSQPPWGGPCSTLCMSPLRPDIGTIRSTSPPRCGICSIHSFNLARLSPCSIRIISPPHPPSG